MLGSRQREKERKKKKINMRRRWDDRLMGGEGSRSGRERERERESRFSTDEVGLTSHPQP